MQCTVRIGGLGLALFVLSTVAVAAQTIDTQSPDALDPALFSIASPIGDVRYLPGRGLHLGRTGITLGGYSTVTFERDEGASPTFLWDDLSLFVIADPLPRLHLFAELELENLVAFGDDVDDTEYVTERLYGDFTLSDEFALRVGKFLTPVGRWNVIHASPLVWTTSRPLVTVLPFDTSTTGVMVSGFFFPSIGTLRYAIYGQPIDQLDPGPDSLGAQRSAGVRLEYAPSLTTELGASYLAFDVDGHWRQLAGADLSWQHDRLQVMAEIAGSGHGVGPASFGFYVQPVFEVWPKLFAVARYEFFDDYREPGTNFVDLGVAYRPIPSLMLKAEYLIADHFDERSPPGVKSSLAILF